VGRELPLRTGPDGAPVSIAALCDHFTEGEILISRALRELEAAGYLVRRRERGPGGVIRTRTYFYDVPGGGSPTPPSPARAATPAPAPEPEAVPAETPSLADADDRAVAILASLRLADLLREEGRTPVEAERAGQRRGWSAHGRERSTPSAQQRPLHASTIGGGCGQQLQLPGERDPATATVVEENLRERVGR
jgi:hypothetical protein